MDTPDNIKNVVHDIVTKDITDELYVVYLHSY